MTPISARWIWLQEDLELGKKHFSRIKGSHQFWIYAIIGFSAVFLVRQFLTKGDRMASLFVLGLLFVAACIAVLIVKKVVSPILRKREFAKRPDAGQEIHWLFSNDDITVTTRDSKSEIKWSAFYKVFHTPAGFLFLPNAQIFYFIPKRAFSTDEDFAAVRSLARTNAKEFGDLK